MRVVLDLDDAIKLVQAELAGPLEATAEPLGPTRIAFEYQGRPVVVQFCTGFMDHAPDFAWVQVKLGGAGSLYLFRDGRGGFVFADRRSGYKGDNLFFRTMADLLKILHAARQGLPGLG